MAGFGQKAASDLEAPETGGAISSQDGVGNGEEDVPCWEYLAEDGEVRRACKHCVVYRVRATRCFLMAGLDSDVGHARQFCEGSCEDCVYFRRLQGLSTQVLFISSDEDLMGRIEWPAEDPMALRFARNGYEASSIIQSFKPEVAIIDLEDLPDHGMGLLDSIAADPRVSHIRVVLVVPPGMVSRIIQRPRHRLVVSILEKPEVCNRIAQVVKDSLLDGPVEKAGRLA